MMPDIDRAATLAVKTLLDFDVIGTPIDPIRILRALPSVHLMTFRQLAQLSRMDRPHLLSTFGEYEDTIIFVKRCAGELHYLIGYNMYRPYYIIQRALAREMGHIILGHDGSRTDEVRTFEAQVFAQHFLCPRPVIRFVQDSSVPLTTMLLGHITGCDEHCLACMRQTPAANVPPELNRRLKERFAPYLQNYTYFYEAISGADRSPLADFGSFMDGYQE